MGIIEVIEDIAGGTNYAYISPLLSFFFFWLPYELHTILLLYCLLALLECILGGLLGTLRRTLLAEPAQASIVPCSLENTGGEGTLLLSLDLAALNLRGGCRRPHDNLIGRLLGRGGLISARVGLQALLELLGVTREHDEVRLVLTKTLLVSLLPLDALVAAAVVHSYPEGTSLELGQAHCLDLRKGEATPDASLGIVLHSGRVHNRPHAARHRAGGNLGRLLGTSISPRLLASWLVEPGLNVPLPVLPELAHGVDLFVVLHFGLTGSREP